jgi:hypothetical protein
MRASSAYLLMQGGEGSSPGALTCAKLRRFVQGDASELTISLHRVLRRVTRPRRQAAGPFLGLADRSRDGILGSRGVRARS